MPSSIRLLWILSLLLGCDAWPGGRVDAPEPASAAEPAALVAPAAAACTAAVDAPFQRSPVNPRLLPGQRFSDGGIDTIIADPDLHWDVPTQSWSLYYMSGHGSSFLAPLVQTIRHATSCDGLTFSVVDTPALAAAADPAAWDHTNTETPSVAYNPDAPPARRYLLVYSGAGTTLQAPGGVSIAMYGIGAAFSADGVEFTRVTAALSPHGAAGQVLTGADVYPSAHLAVVADPEVVYRNGIYHLWFSSYACAGATAGVCDTTLAYGVGHATSSDGIHWAPDRDVPIASLLRIPSNPATGPAQPSVVWDAIRDRWEMWATSDAAGETAAQPVVFNNMAGVWHATSHDGAAWQIDYQGARDLTWDPSAPGEHLGLLTGADVAQRGDERRMVYVGFDDRNVPPGFFVPIRSSPGFMSGVFALNVATRPRP
jgi:hypothetical protein